MKTIFCSHYLAPIAYYKRLLFSDEVLIESCNFYEKKTYQNRCEILSANGKIALSVPVEKPSRAKVPFKDIRIAYHEDWQHQHLRALSSAYKNSPFFEYYIEDFLPFYEKKTSFLLDLNMGLHHTVLSAIEEQRPTVLTSNFYQQNDVQDLRFSFHPKKEYDGELKRYTQVFSDKMDFVPHLSIIDLLFNLGPEVELYMKSQG